MTMNFQSTILQQAILYTDHLPEEEKKYILFWNIKFVFNTNKIDRKKEKFFSHTQHMLCLQIDIFEAMNDSCGK